MASQEPSQLSASWPGLIALLVAVVGVFVSRTPLVSPRPTPAGRHIKDIEPDNSVPARLWQDPLAAALRGEPAGGDMASLMNDHAPSDQDERKILFIFDCIPPGNTAEDRETRRRERYAILSALGTAGYAPLQPDRIHYADVPPSAKCQKDTNTATAGKTVGKGSKDDVGFHADIRITRGSFAGTWGREEDKVRIPYEWVGPFRSEMDEVKSEWKYPAVCVLWVSLLPSPYQQLHFLQQLRKDIHKTCPSCQFAICGRIASADLTAMLKEDVNFADSCGEGITLFVTYSTSPCARKCPSRKANGLKLESFIDTDKRLVDALVEELKQRHIDPNKGGKDPLNPLAVIAERDTEYGREVHNLFDKSVCEKSGQKTCQPDYLKRRVYHYSYLRGLDGKVLGKQTAKANGEPPAESSGDAAAGKGPAKGEPTAQEGEGESQIDYVRRLADRMQAELITDHGKGREFKSIAVVGSDVYDTLLLLKALRPKFPNAVFCTTDLDVRLIQLGDYADTRNLVIASHYGLSLREELQGRVAPFRSSYDTASYLGCLRAIEYRPLENYVDILQSEDDGAEGFKAVPKKGSWKKGMPVHLYEMSRSSGAYELTLFNQDEDTVGPENPRLDPWLTRDHHLILLLGIGLIVGILLLPVSFSWQRFLSWALEPAWLRWLILAIVLLGLVLVWQVYRAHTSGNQEAFELFEGISVWPTIILHFLACYLCVYYIGKASQDLRERNNEVINDFKFANLTSSFPGLWQGICELYQSWSKKPPQNLNVSQLHQEFLKRGAFWKRAWRTGILAFVNLVLFVIIWRTFEHTGIQARGDIAYNWHLFLLIVTLISLAALLMFVVDSTLLSYRFVDAFIRQKQRNWSTQLLDDEAAKWGLSSTQYPSAIADIEEAADHSLSIRYIDRVTNPVARMINYPFVVLLILIVAQNRLFDDWHWNIPLALMVLFSAGVAVACAVMLQLEAKKARRNSLKILNDLWRKRVGPTEDAVREKLAQIRSEIEQLDTGAFSGFSQNPVVKAVLLPLLGGGLAALEAILPYFQSLF